ncbi:MAG: hypothetical protein ABR591_08810 [Candidatus Velthaea sp.]
MSASTAALPPDGVFSCGPLEVHLHAIAGLREKIAETLHLYDLRWPGPFTPVEIVAERSNAPVVPAQASFLLCARMAVDAVPGGLYATTASRAAARYRAAQNSWHVTVPDVLLDTGKLEEIEDILSLVLTTGWRKLGFTPVHGAAVVKNDRCAILCAATGGGKSTLTAALVRRGWRTLGDDKLLLRVNGGVPEVNALLHTFNLHPRTRTWFPEVGNLERLPRYSVWTEKRKVKAADIWPSIGALCARPTALVLLNRVAGAHGISASPLDRATLLDTLLRQTVIPNEPAVARTIVGTITRTALQLRGIKLDIGDDAYGDPACVDGVEDVLAAR